MQTQPTRLPFHPPIVHFSIAVLALVIGWCGCGQGQPQDNENTGATTDTISGDGTDEGTGEATETGETETGIDSSTGQLELDVERILEDIAYLADDARGGREASTPGNEQALDYLSERLAAAGIEPLAGASYRRSFTYPRWHELSAPGLTIDGEELFAGVDYDVVRFSPSASGEAEVVFVGWALSVPPYDESEYPDCPLSPAGYDELSGINIEGKIVLRFMGAPGISGDPRTLCPQNEPTGQMPVATLLVPSPGGGVDFMAGVTARVASPPSAPVMTLRLSALEELLPALAPQLATAATFGGPSSGVLGITAQVSVETETQETTVDNVIGVIPGTDSGLRSQVVFITGHMDHVGSELGTGVIYNGADDNASGTAVALELARHVAALPGGPKRTVVFAAWNAEEVALCGSCAYVERPDFPMTTIEAVLNFDAVGAGMGTGAMVFNGAEAQNTGLMSILHDSLHARSWNHAVLPLGAVDASDHACFFAQGVPAITFQSLGNHPFTHTEADTIDKMNPDALQVSAEIGWALLEPLARGNEGELASKVGGGESSFTQLEKTHLESRPFFVWGPGSSTLAY